MTRSSKEIELLKRVKALEAENQNLRRLLETHGISLTEGLAEPSPSVIPPVSKQQNYSINAKISIFRNLFRGRTDVYPVRWTSQKSGKSGYSPACANEWRPGVCAKPRVKCAECNNRSLLPVTDETIYNYLSGKITIGVYPLLFEDYCWFLAVDFDKAEWREDVTGFIRSCEELSLSAHLEVSRSGKGAHVWLFFSQAVPAADARQLGSAIISHTCARNRQLELSSYDRLFPNQDRMPKGGFGNLIALQLQKEPRARGCSVFVDEQLNPLPDQWNYLAAFQNPTFYQNQALRLSVWNTPRIIGCADNLAHHIALPRGCFGDVEDLLKNNNIHYQIDDKRYEGEGIKVAFTGTLRQDQTKAVSAMLQHDTGVLCAPTAFGKTVTAAAIIAKRSVSTLILVHRKELMLQWRERLATFLDLGKIKIGNRGGGRKKLYGKIDIALIQTLARNPDDETIEQYGQVIVDEGHHISAASFEGLSKRAKARFVIGLTATPIRRDGWDPIIFMQCGPIRHRAAKAIDAPTQLMVLPHFIENTLPHRSSDGIQLLFNQLAEDVSRNRLIANEILNAFRQGHKILVLSERTAHLSRMELLLKDELSELHVLHGRLPKRKRTQTMMLLEQLPPDAPRVILASGKLVGEGFDHPPLDTLFLTMPLSWKGTLQQYAGRLHRSHANKEIVRIHDYIDSGYPQLERMWRKRITGYKAMGYQIVQDELFSDTNTRDNAKAPPPTCCNKPPK